MKKFKDFLAAKSITEDAFKAMEAKEQAGLYKDYMDSLADSVVSKEDYNALKKEFETLKSAETVSKADYDGLVSKLDELALEVKAAEGSKVEGGALVKEFEANKDAIKSIIRGRGGEVEIKAITNRASISGNTNAYVLPDIGQLGVKRRALYDVLPKVQISNRANDNGIIKYHDWDEDTITRAAAVVAEGGTFPESTAKFIERTLPIRKIGDTLPVTEEFGEDAAQDAAELEMFLDVNVNTVIDNQIINGDNTGNNLKGLIVSVPAYTAVASSIPGANIYDLCRKVRTDIVKNRGSKYLPDIVVANSETLDRYFLAKDANENYLFRVELGTNIGSLTIVEDNNMPDNQLVIGDRRFAKIYEKTGVVLSEGLANAQFLSDAKTIKARKRLAMLIRTVDATGFRKVTNITTALATLESTP